MILGMGVLAAIILVVAVWAVVQAYQTAAVLGKERDVVILVVTVLVAVVAATVLVVALAALAAAGDADRRAEEMRRVAGITEKEESK